MKIPSNSEIDLDLETKSNTPKEAFFLFRPTTVGLNKIKKTKAFQSYQDAFNSGLALNIIDGTPDKIFAIIKTSDIHCHTSITDELPFAEAFFRYSRLSDSANKFSQGLTNPNFNRQEFNPQTAQLYAGLSINPLHPALNPEIDLSKPKDQLFAEAGLTPNNAPLLQSAIQHQLGINPLPPQQFPEYNRLMNLCQNTELFPTLKEANSFISNKIMKRKF